MYSQLEKAEHTRARCAPKGSEEEETVPTTGSIAHSINICTRAVNSQPFGSTILAYFGNSRRVGPRDRSGYSQQHCARWSPSTREHGWPDKAGRVRLGWVSGRSGAGSLGPDHPPALAFRQGLQV